MLFIKSHWLFFFFSARQNSICFLPALLDKILKERSNQLLTSEELSFRGHEYFTWRPWRDFKSASIRWVDIIMLSLLSMSLVFQSLRRSHQYAQSEKIWTYVDKCWDYRISIKEPVRVCSILCGIKVEWSPQTDVPCSLLATEKVSRLIY